MFLCHSETVKRCQSLPLSTRHLCNGVKRKLCSVLIHIKIVQKKYFQHLHQYWSPLCMGSIVDWLLQNLIQNAWVGGTLVLSFNLELLTRNGILIRFLQIGKIYSEIFRSLLVKKSKSSFERLLHPTRDCWIIQNNLFLSLQSFKKSFHAVICLDESWSYVREEWIETWNRLVLESALDIKGGKTAKCVTVRSWPSPSWSWR